MVLLFSETTDCRRGVGGEVWSFCLVRQNLHQLVVFLGWLFVAVHQ